MGKTKTVVITGAPEESKTGEEKYKQRQKKKAPKEEKEKVRVPGLGGGERVVAVATEPLPEEEEAKEEKKKIKAKAPRKRGKKYKAARAKVDKDKLYKIKDAVKIIKDTSYTKFDGSVELHVVVKKQGLSVNLELPHSTGKEKKIEIADDKTIDKLKKGKINFDILLATPEIMQKLVPFAKILGPKGLMPNPKNGTLIKDKKQAKKFSENTLNLKTEKSAPLIHTVVGKVSMDDKKLIENTKAVLDAVGARQLEKAYLKATMGPSVKLQI
jgi:large subunit ribosomal protein L1